VSVYEELMNETQQRPGRRQKGTSRPFGSRGPRAGKLSPKDQAAFDKVFPPPKKKAPPTPPTDVAHTEYEGPSLREKLEKLRRGHSVPRSGEKKSTTVQGGWLSKAAATAGAGRKIVGSWAQRRHKKPGETGDAPITYADK
jgi:hypothetical protein